jgi:hypothetical protein
MDEIVAHDQINPNLAGLAIVLAMLWHPLP